MSRGHDDWLIKYQMGATSIRSEIVINAFSINDARKILESMIPEARFLSYTRLTVMGRPMRGTHRDARSR